MRSAWLLFGVLLACKKEPATKHEEPVSTGPQPLQTHCGPSPCRSYEEAVLHVRKLAAPGGGPGCVRANFGTCGALRWVEYSDGFSSFEELFEAGGKMVAARTRADIQPAGAIYGDFPACTPVATERLCGN